jgi:hypothetical protein
LNELLTIPLLEVERNLLLLYARKLDIANDFLATLNQTNSATTKRKQCLSTIDNPMTWSLLEMEGVNAKIWSTRIRMSLFLSIHRFMDSLTLCILRSSSLCACVYSERARDDHRNELESRAATATSVAASGDNSTLLSTELNRNTATSNNVLPTAEPSPAAVVTASMTVTVTTGTASTKDEKSDAPPPTASAAASSN